MKIPKTFTLGAIEYKVSMVNHVDKGESLGMSDTDEGWVQIMKGLPRSRTEQVMCHELMHCLLGIAGRDDLSQDEHLVDVMGTFLHQYLETSKGTL